jgi:hypothetical protein
MRAPVIGGTEAGPELEVFCKSARIDKATPVRNLCHTQARLFEQLNRSQNSRPYQEFLRRNSKGRLEVALQLSW